VIETDEGRACGGEEKRRQRDRQQRQREDQRHGRRSRRSALPPTRPARAIRVRVAAVRADRLDMTARRCSSVISGQSEISAIVRPQPMQRPLRGSTTQILTHGVAAEGEWISIALI
jgi:hypothetical protein